MGKKSKKFNQTPDFQLPFANLAKSELEEGIKFVKSKKQEVIINSETNSCSNFNTKPVKKTKKNNRKRDVSDTMTHELPEQIQSEEAIESFVAADPSTITIKKKKHKELPENSDQELNEEIELSAPKEKKKKGNLLGLEDKQEMAQANVEIEDNETQKSLKKKKNKNKLQNELDPKEERLKKENGEVTQKKKKTRNKAKTGAPVLNDEEAQVTQEDIDKFCDELDEEDNKQYEDWVKLLDARLSKKQTKKE